MNEMKQIHEKHPMNIVVHISIRTLNSIQMTMTTHHPKLERINNCNITICEENIFLKRDENLFDIEKLLFPLFFFFIFFVFFYFRRQTSKD